MAILNNLCRPPGVKSAAEGFYERLQSPITTLPRAPRVVNDREPQVIVAGLHRNAANIEPLDERRHGMPSLMVCNTRSCSILLEIAAHARSRHRALLMKAPCCRQSRQRALEISRSEP